MKKHDSLQIKIKKEKTIESMLSISARAGKAISGEGACLTSIRSGESFLVVLAEDASDNSKKLIKNKCAFYEVPLIELKVDKETLGKIIGKGERAAVSIADSGLAKEIYSIYRKAGSE